MRALCFLLLSLALCVSAAAGVRLAEPAPLDPADLDLAKQLQASGALRRAAELVNARVALSKTVTLRHASCDGPNAWYLPETREVQVCLGLARHLAGLLAAQLDDEEQLLQALDGALRFIALHELGHALVDVLQLPVTGREEDAVDQFAVWLLLGEGDSAAVLSAASLFGSEVSGGADVAAAHSLDQQRYFSMLCWVYGSDAEARGALLEDWALPADRAAQCGEEYAQLGRSWQRLLAAHVPPAPKPDEVTGKPTAKAVVAGTPAPVAAPTDPDATREGDATGPPPR